MKKPTWKRFGLGLIQQITALFIFIIIAWILFNSYLSVETMNGLKTYYLEPLHSESQFEDSDVFGDIFQTAVSDITRLVVIKGQMETDGQFDSRKRIDVTKYADRIGAGNGCPVTAVYELDDLIKWGKYGVEYNNRALSMTDFVNYYGYVLVPENFMLDENGQLSFAGFREVYYNQEDFEANTLILESYEEYLRVSEAMEGYTQQQLEDLVFSYIIARASDEISVSREDDGSFTVYIRMLSNRYEPVQGNKPLFEYASNWIDYIKLQQNVVEAIDSLSQSYVLYQNCNDLYETEKSNIKYVVRMMSSEGLKTVTNIPEVAGFVDSDLTDFFSEYRRYLIYYPDSLEFIGNTSMSESDIYSYMSEYEYAYPETTHIWIGVDTNYPIAGDAFYHAHSIYQQIVPNVSIIIGGLSLLMLLWFALGVYLTVTAGIAYTEEGEKVVYVNRFDRIWTEVVVVLFAAATYGGFVGYRYLLQIANEVYISYMQLAEVNFGLWQRYFSFGLYGFAVSIFFNLFWYSFIRRVKNSNLWKDSFINWLIVGFQKTTVLIFTHKNAVISTLIPYIMFLMANFLSLYAATRFEKQSTIQILIVICVIVIDLFVGLFLFKHNAEQVDIVEGIQRIREGEVDYKLETDHLHGANKEMADAVNNIGEGIRNAVKTSMKDEQMKTDLITNVSHDIKTPLTSIINYVDLLKRLRIQEEPAKSYIEVLDGKAQRLKQLTDDLVEASKISSGNIVLDMERLNLAELILQAIGEFSEKLEEQQLEVIFEQRSTSADIYADSRRMWRVIENLFNNICKYAMENTRVYVDLETVDERVRVSVKNISRRRMNIQADELTERFIRGDSSRTTEGSGLGLSIAKSLTQVQNGEFELILDGDLFKVVLSFPQYEEPEEAASIAENSGAEKEE